MLRQWAIAFLVPVVLLVTTGASRAESIAPLVSGDETIVVTHHRIQTIDGTLEYEARAGRLPIRHDESGEVRGYAYFTAYIVKPKPVKRAP